MQTPNKDAVTGCNRKQIQNHIYSVQGAESDWNILKRRRAIIFTVSVKGAEKGIPAPICYENRGLIPGIFMRARDKKIFTV